ncbi:MAG TPA: FixH family protein [Fimbriimonas sp.]
MIRNLISIAVLGALVAGCSSTKQADAPPPATDAPVATQPSSSAPGLGTKQEKEHFAVTLETEPAEPKMGKVNFVAEVWHHGEPAPGQTVRVETSMPSMNMDGPSVDLKPTTGNVYEGTADLPMGGEYEAKVSVGGAEGHANEFTYRFNVSQ